MSHTTGAEDRQHAKTVAYSIIAADNDDARPQKDKPVHLIGQSEVLSTIGVGSEVTTCGIHLLKAIRYSRVFMAAKASSVPVTSLCLSGLAASCLVPCFCYDAMTYVN
jgi:hypothetical protein